MGNTMASQGVRARGTVEIIGQDKRLVVRSREGSPLRRYEKWRFQWCVQIDNRNLWTPPGFREGKLTPLTVGFWLYLWIFKKSIYRRLTNG
jgi:hypothetical protein